MTLANSHEIIKVIMINLFSAEERRLLKLKEALIEANRECYPGRPHDGFTYSGQVFDPGNLVARGRRTRVPLHHSLADQMDVYLQDHNQVWTDRHSISQMLYQLLRSCSDTQEIRDALPECITDTLPNLKSLPRTKPAGHTLAHDPRLYRQFEKLLPRIEFYATVKLFY